MNKFITVCFLAIFFCAGVHAQAFIIERGSTVVSFGTITEAIAALQDGDVFYIPPGVHGSGTMSITKRVNMIGAGYAGGGASVINGTVQFSANGNNITGIRFAAMSLQGISNTHFNRCMFTSDVSGTSNTSSMSGILFTECEFRSTFGSGYTPRGVVASKCIFKGQIIVRESTIYNSIIGLTGNNTFPTLNTDDNCVFQNNIFISSMVNTTTEFYMYNVRNTTFNNNLFVGGVPNYSQATDCTFTPDNIVEELYSNVFTDPAAEDYTLKAVCRGKNAGTDGKDMGLFGTSVPFKESRLPAIPYFSLKNIGTEVNEAGNLPVKFVVEAQER